MSLTQPVGNSDVMYLSVVGGTLVQKSEEGVPEARKREYETSTGAKGVKWEILHKNLTGFITGLEFRDTDFGTQLGITIEANGEVAKLSLSTSSNFFTDFARKLPNIDLSKEVTMNPFDFEKDGKKWRGMTITQGSDKIKDYYFDYEKKEAINGIPSVKKEDIKSMTKNKWKTHFLTVEDFLIEKVRDTDIPFVDTGKKEEVSVDDAKTVFDESVPF